MRCELLHNSRYFSEVKRLTQSTKWEQEAIIMALVLQTDLSPVCNSSDKKVVPVFILSLTYVKCPIYNKKKGGEKRKNWAPCVPMTTVHHKL